MFCEHPHVTSVGRLCVSSPFLATPLAPCVTRPQPLGPFPRDDCACAQTVPTHTPSPPPAACVLPPRTVQTLPCGPGCFVMPTRQVSCQAVWDRPARNLPRKLSSLPCLQLLGPRRDTPPFQPVGTSGACACPSRCLVECHIIWDTSHEHPGEGLTPSQAELCRLTCSKTQSRRGTLQRPMACDGGPRHCCLAICHQPPSPARPLLYTWGGSC